MRLKTGRSAAVAAATLVALARAMTLPAGLAAMIAAGALASQAQALPPQATTTVQPPQNNAPPRQPPPVQPAPIDRPVGVGANDTAQLPVQYVYTFTLKSFRITNTRSVHNDTDYVSLAASVGGKRLVSIPPIAMGDLNNGTYTVNATLPEVAVGPDDAISFSYLIVNSGYDQNSAEAALQAAMMSVGGIAGTAAGALASGGTATVVGALAGAGAGTTLARIFVADCDGTVAAANHEWSGAALAKQVLGKTMTTADDNKGTDSPTGCGSNSQYYVEWSVTGVKVQAAPSKAN